VERQAVLPHLALAGLLALLLAATVAMPVSASAQHLSASAQHLSASAQHLSASAQRSRSTERYALKLVNCLRTGGRIGPGGFCIGYGSGRFSAYRKPLVFSHKISNKVAFPWASRIARTNICGHSLAGSSIDRRFRTVGLHHIANGENVACLTSASPRQTVAFGLRYWYREASYGGAHWRQLKDRRFRAAGIGVARIGGRTRLVVDFYGRRVD
jgi:hypothetical protein